MNDEKITVNKEYFLYLARLTEMLLITMQAAFIEQCNNDAVSAMEWITNTLEDPYLIPEITEGLTAQDFFDREMEKKEAEIREAYGNQD